MIANQPLLSVETDEAVVEIPSPWSGTISRRFGGKREKGPRANVAHAIIENPQPSCLNVQLKTLRKRNNYD